MRDGGLLDQAGDLVRRNLSLVSSQLLGHQFRQFGFRETQKRIEEQLEQLGVEAYLPQPRP